MAECRTKGNSNKLPVRERKLVRLGLEWLVVLRRKSDGHLDRCIELDWRSDGHRHLDWCVELDWRSDGHLDGLVILCWRSGRFVIGASPFQSEN